MHARPSSSAAADVSIDGYSLEDNVSADLELQVVEELTETIYKDNIGDDYRSPLPLEREEICILPLWMVACIILLSVAGISGAIFELRYQYQRR